MAWCDGVSDFVEIATIITECKNRFFKKTPLSYIAEHKLDGRIDSHLEVIEVGATTVIPADLAGARLQAPLENGARYIRFYDARCNTE